MRHPPRALTNSRSLSLPPLSHAQLTDQNKLLYSPAGTKSGFWVKPRLVGWMWFSWASQCLRVPGSGGKTLALIRRRGAPVFWREAASPYLIRKCVIFSLFLLTSLAIWQRSVVGGVVLFVTINAKYSQSQYVKVENHLLNTRLNVFCVPLTNGGRYWTKISATFITFKRTNHICSSIRLATWLATVHYVIH